MLDYLEEEGVIRFAEDSWYWADRSYPAEQVSLRSATNENVVIINTTKGKNNVIGEMDRPSAKELLHDGAVYLHRGDQFFVENLDLENNRCFVTETNVNFYTDTIVKSDIKILHEDKKIENYGCEILIGDVLVRSQVTKFKKIKFKTHENLGYGEVFLPEEEMHTKSAVLIFSPNTKSGMAFKNIPDEIKEYVIAHLGVLIKNIAPLFLLCDSRDIGIAERLKDPHTKYPSLFVYDSYPGGIGLSEGFLKDGEKILRACADLVKDCKCSNGCPSCIGPWDEDSSINRKEAVINFLFQWMYR